MVKFSISRFILMAAIVIGVIVLVPTIKQITQQRAMTSAYELLTDPFLQFPTEDSVRVVWFTDFPGSRHTLTYGTSSYRKATATTTKLSRTREDQKSRVGNQTEDAQLYQKPIMRDIWRHEAIVTGLTPGLRVPYQVSSVKENGQVFTSKLYSLSALPNPETPQKILLTSDHQLMPMTAANLQKVVETVGQIDGVFYVGDLVNVPDRASEWFDDNRGGAFFPCLQGRANYQLEKNGVKTTYHGGEIIQNAPIFPVVGNHEVMGRFSMEKDLNSQFNDPFPRAAAQAIYQQKAEHLNPDNDPNYYQAWLKNNTYNTDTYNEIFSLPNGKPYYAVTFGNIRLVVLYITNIWRTYSLSPNAKGRYQEREQDLDNPIAWGYGQHIFEPVSKGSPQYQWLQAEFNSTEFQQAKYKIVMLHHPPHSLGGNIVPAYTNPVQIIERDQAGKVTAVRYEYPKDKDYIIRDVVPLLEAAGVQLVYYGHSHLWNRFVDGNGMHFLESSNVGNSYGAYVGENNRPVPTGYKENYSATGDPNGLQPVMPTIAPLLGENNQPLPYIASNDVTVFSILDTGTGIVTSYRFDTRSPNSDVIKFDQFELRPRD
ncbi:MAG: metallophosphoesterase family protein [Moorea sp. SIO3G5]|nr:metallophosphoesterase family protein [Moorena sp. SIO3G5]